ncbi:MAG: hypothetical protein IPL24_09160 [Bacteroidetes bacterium]|nr:hypothetical protein [Bacteroidota bacterium]
MIKLLNTIFGIILITFSAEAQNRNSIWCFGDSAGIDFRNISMPVPISTGMDSRGTCASISDSLGSLLFYAYAAPDGTWPPNGKVYNANHQIMLNGDSINGAGMYDEMIIIPKPGNSSIYYLFPSISRLSVHQEHSIQWSI